MTGLISESPRLELIAPPPSEWGKVTDLGHLDLGSERGMVSSGSERCWPRLRPPTMQPRPRLSPQKHRT
jgi:hypothetical protein